MKWESKINEISIKEKEVSGMEKLDVENKLDYKSTYEKLDENYTKLEKEDLKKLIFEETGWSSEIADKIENAELNENSEHGNGNHSTLHLEKDNSWRNNPELKQAYTNERKEYLKSRSQMEE